MSGLESYSTTMQLASYKRWTGNMKSTLIHLQVQMHGGHSMSYVLRPGPGCRRKLRERKAKGEEG
jgi:hypothetical protein